MARTSSTPYAILGFLTLTPMSGYDIRKEAASSIGHFWSESYGQIYPSLRKLEAEGLVRRQNTDSSGGRERQTFAITPRGRKALQKWRARAPHSAPPRNELLLKLFFADEQSATHDANWIAELKEKETARLAEYRSLRRQLLKEQRNHPSLPFWLATLRYGIHRSRAVVCWCQETLDMLGTYPAVANQVSQKNG